VETISGMWFRGGDKGKQQQESLFDDPEWLSFSETDFWNYSERPTKSSFFYRG
jgi:hypothetical protein